MFSMLLNRTVSVKPFPCLEKNGMAWPHILPIQLQNASKPCLMPLLQTRRVPGELWSTFVNSISPCAWKGRRSPLGGQDGAILLAQSRSRSKAMPPLLTMAATNLRGSDT